MLINLIDLQKQNGDEPIYRQITHQVVDLIKKQIIKPGYKLPGTRKLATELGINRQTVISALDQLVIEGWLESIPGKGTFVCKTFNRAPEVFELQESMMNRAPVHVIPSSLQRDLHLTKQKYHLDDGLPDPRLAPTAELARAYKSYLTKGNVYPRFTYGDTKGHLYLREALCQYLLESRAMNLIPDQIIITRGVTQALYLCIKGFLQPGDKVAVGELNWESANANFHYHGMELIKVKVDEQGLDTEHLADLMAKYEIKMVYLTPHHQYPTTVIMPAARRLKLIQLAREHNCYVFEDDYDYDFYYSANPVMPLASAEHGDFVLYAGSFTKAISPVFRVGYLVANPNQIDYLSRIRRMIDRQGDALLELAIAEMLNIGIIQRYLNRNRRIYQQRRDFFADQLITHLADYVDFKKPQGGMSIWTHFDSSINLRKLYEQALRHDLYIPSGEQISQGNHKLNVTRLGYASSTEEELEESVKILRRLITNL
ncbi:MAG: PLP-dependent aminotransferase family protein [Marinoscillum sp.]